MVVIGVACFSGKAQTCIPLPAVNGDPSPAMAPPSWEIWMPSPDIVSGLGPWPGGAGYVMYDVDGFSTSGGEMSLMLAQGMITEGLQTTLLGLTPGETYFVSLEWQQATLANESFTYSEGQLSITIDGTETIFTSDGGVDDGWQVATVSFVAGGPSAVFQCRAIETDVPHDFLGYAIVVDDFPCGDYFEIDVEPAEICSGECVDIEVDVFGGTGEISFEWSPDIDDEDGFVTLCPETTTTYQVIGHDEEGLSDTISFTIIVHENPIVDLGLDRFLSPCVEEEIELDAGHPDEFCLWQDGSMTPTILVSEIGTYWVEVTNDYGCIGADTVEVAYSEMLDLEAKIEFVINGNSSEDGATGGCTELPVQFNDLSFIEAPGEIVAWYWDFGDGNTAFIENPVHFYESAGEYTISLMVVSDEGCSATYEIVIVMTNSLVYEIYINQPSCFGFSDGSVTVDVLSGGDSLDFTISDGTGEELNEGNSNTANTLSSGWYYILVESGTACSVDDSVFLEQPAEITVDLTINGPPCHNTDAGWVRVDSVYNAGGDYDQIVYIWNPNPAGIGGTDADSSYNMAPGDYTLTINDQNGCSNVYDITLERPDSLYFSEFGVKPAYCRLHEYQNGNGVVFGAAAGGTPDYTYLWTNLDNGETSPNSTWGGRNPGNYELMAIDENGCIIKQHVLLDSLNPIADFTVISDQLNSDLKGTAPVEAIFVNTSQFFANPENPIADTTFFWNINTPQDDWVITHDFFKSFDTTYLAKGETYEIDVCLVAQNSNGCVDTTCKILTIFEPIQFDAINVFSPNGDGINDEFTFVFRSASISSLKCVIVNRWGVIVHEMNSIQGSWDGTDRSGKPCSNGTYFYNYQIITDNGTTINGQSSVTIVGIK